MQNDDVLRLANQAGIIPWACHEWQHGTFVHIDDGMDGDVACLLQFAQLVAAAEREACAKVCESLLSLKGNYLSDDFGVVTKQIEAAWLCADAIRAREAK
jgi:hypothetical protein